jgi:hypothetical protein
MVPDKKLIHGNSSVTVIACDIYQIQSMIQRTTSVRSELRECRHISFCLSQDINEGLETAVT